MLEIFIVCVLILCFFVYWYFTKGNRLIAKIPGPRAWPLIGNSWSYILPPEKLFIYLRYLYKSYGGINQVHAINMKAVNIYDPEDIETLMSTTRYNNKQTPYNFLKPWLCDGLLISNGVKWHQRRKLLTKAFHFNILKRYLQTFTQQTDLFLERIAKEEGKITNIVPLVTQTTVQIICETAMGTENKITSFPINKYLEALHELGKVVEYRICRVWYYFDFTFSFSSLYKMQKKIVKILHEFTVNIIKVRKEESMTNCKNYTNLTDSSEKEVYGEKGRLAMLDLLLQNEKEGSIDFNGIREEVETFMFEGHDTIAMAISFFIMIIANESSSQDKIYEEMQRIFGNSDRDPTMEDLNEMKYLECCIKESLRLYPSVPFVARYVSDGAKLSGYDIPPDTICHIHIFDVHRCEKIYPEPEVFIPERFTPENSALRHPYAYIPFSAGPRNCIGQKFAMFEMKTVMSGLLRKYRLEPITTPKDLVFMADLVLRTSHPIFVRFLARK